MSNDVEGEVLDKVCINCARYYTSEINQDNFSCEIPYQMDMPKSVADNIWCYGRDFIQAHPLEIERRLKEISKYKESEE